MSYEPHIHLYRKGAPEAPFGLLLLHGTGGDEHQLIELATAAADAIPVLSLRGRVIEEGLNRHFRRFPDGRLDEEDVKVKVDELGDAVSHFRAFYDLPRLVGIGYSNGANLIAATLMLRPDLLAGAVLMRSVLPLQAHLYTPALTGIPVLVLTGQDDEIAAPVRAEELVTQLRKYGARLDHRILETGHDLTEADTRLVGGWLGGFPTDA